MEECERAQDYSVHTRQSVRDAERYDTDPYILENIFCNHATDLSDGVDETLMADFLLPVCTHVLNI